MVERICMQGRVRLVFDVDPIPTPNFTHPLTWIRQHAGPTGQQERVLSFIENRPRYRTTSGPGGGLVTVNIRLGIPNLFVAREMQQYSLGVERILRHERGHVPEWESVMVSSLADVCTDLGSLIYDGNVTASRVNAIVGMRIPQWTIILREAGNGWDRRDYPSLHQDLRARGVPPM